MFAIGRLSYQTETAPPALLLGNTSVYGMRTFPTAHDDSHNVQQQAEIGVFFVHSALSALDVEQYYEKVRDVKRVVKHFDLSTVPVTRLNFMTSVNSDVARNFVLLPGLCDRLDGLHMLESGVGLQHVETFESESSGWSLPSLFHKMRQRGGGYLVVLAQEQTSDRTEGATKLPVCWAAEALAVNRSLDVVVSNPLAQKREGGVVAVPVRLEDRAFSRPASTTTSLEEIMATGKVLVVHSHSSLGPALRSGPSHGNKV